MRFVITVETIRCEIVNRETHQSIILWNGDVIRLIKQIIQFDGVNIQHPNEWIPLHCNTFHIKRFFDSTKLLIIMKYNHNEHIMLDELAVKSICSLNPSFIHMLQCHQSSCLK